MSTSALLRVLAVGLLSLAGSARARAQCLPLAVLTSEVATGQAPTFDGLKAQLSGAEWEAHPTGGGAGYWLGVPVPGAPPESGPPLRLELRRINQENRCDVVLKTTQRACLTSLRAELRRLGLKPEPVTCQQCEAERFTADQYSVTLYQQAANYAAGRAPYPFLIVVHLLGTAPASAPAVKQ